MLVLPNREIVTDNEAEYADMPPLVEEEIDSDEGEECTIEGGVKLGSVLLHEDVTPPPLPRANPKVSARRLPNSRQDSRIYSSLKGIHKSTIDLGFKKYFKCTSHNS